MSWLLLVLNEVSLAIVMVSAMTIYLRRPRPQCLRQHVMQLALVLVAVGAFVSLLAPIYWSDQPRWWAVTMRVGIALIALRWLWFALWGGLPVSTGRHVEPDQP